MSRFLCSKFGRSVLVQVSLLNKFVGRVACCALHCRRFRAVRLKMRAKRTCPYYRHKLSSLYPKANEIGKKKKTRGTRAEVVLHLVHELHLPVFSHLPVAFCWCSQLAQQATPVCRTLVNATSLITVLWHAHYLNCRQNMPGTLVEWRTKPRSLALRFKSQTRATLVATQQSNLITFEHAVKRSQPHDRNRRWKIIITYREDNASKKRKRKRCQRFYGGKTVYMIRYAWAV